MKGRLREEKGRPGFSSRAALAIELRVKGLRSLSSRHLSRPWLIHLRRPRRLYYPAPELPDRWGSARLEMWD